MGLVGVEEIGGMRQRNKATWQAWRGQERKRRLVDCQRKPRILEDTGGHNGIGGRFACLVRRLTGANRPASPESDERPCDTHWR